MLSAGDRFEGYVIDGVDAILGHGRYATVYRARAADSGRPVALKVLDEHHRHRARVARLRREFEFARRLDHPHIVSVYEHGAGWLSMELVDGGGVAGLEPMAKRLEALEQIADALDYAHNRAILHCDVKPANILVHARFSRHGAKLIDFGVAQVTGHAGEGVVEASLPYAAPELITGHAPTEATDEYALACTAVELITGSPPFACRSTLELIDAHLHREPPRHAHELDWLPTVFDSIVAKALAKSPVERYSSCREFVALIIRALHER